MIIKGIDITNYRKKHKLTQEEFAQLTGNSARTIQNYEAGKVIPKSKHAILHEILFGKLSETPEELYKNVSNEDKKAVITHNKLLLQKVEKLIQKFEAVEDPSISTLTALKEAIDLKNKIQDDLDLLM